MRLEIVSFVRFFSCAKERLTSVVILVVLLASQKAITAASACDSSFSEL